MCGASGRALIQQAQGPERGRKGQRKEINKISFLITQSA
jgi:hypothetical protein